jgi:hypothetical protein
MRPIVLASAPALLAVLAACSGPITTTLDDFPTASVPASISATDVSDCRFQAIRQAEMRYPRQPLDKFGNGVRRPPALPDEPAKSEAAQRFFRQCLEQKARLTPSSPPSAPAS